MQNVKKILKSKTCNVTIYMYRQVVRLTLASKPHRCIRPLVTYFEYIDRLAWPGICQYVPIKNAVSLVSPCLP